MIKDLNERALEIFRHLVDAYCEKGLPVGSRLIAERLNKSLSSATIRHVMAQLESCGLLVSPHTSAGRIPSERGLRLFIDGLLQIGTLDKKDEQRFKEQCQQGETVSKLLESATHALSGLTQCAGLVTAPKEDGALKHIEFARLSTTEALVVLVFESGHVENRVMSLPPGLPSSSLIQAANYLNATLIGKTMAEVRHLISDEVALRQQELDDLSQHVIKSGLSHWNDSSGQPTFLVKGQAHLFNKVHHVEELKRMRGLFEQLESHENLLKLVDASIEADGVQIYIGSENDLFSASGFSMVVSPYRGRNEQILGAIGVIGPQHINYARIVPMVDYTAKMISKFLERGMHP